MTIVDIFEYEGKKALYLSIDNSEIPAKISKLIKGSKIYNILKHDTLHSIVGEKALTVLIDTTDTFEIGENVILS